MILILIVLVTLLIYFYTTRNHGYWAKRNVKHEKPIPVFGNHLKNFLCIESITDITQRLYHKFKDEKVIGYFRGNTPELIIKDPDLVRQILNVDFTSFYVRGLKKRNNDIEPMLNNLFSAEGDKWKLLRQRLTGAFTTAKLKNMFPLVVRCAEKLQSVTEELAVKEEEYDVRELMARFTTEFIGACGFGIEMDTINDEQSHFRKLGKQIFKPPLKSFVLNMVSELFPEATMNLFSGDRIVDDAMEEIVVKIRDQRNGKPIGRHDFMDLLLELESNGKIVGESMEHVNPDGTVPTVSMDMSVQCMAAQLFVFFAAGFETSSSSTSFLLHELAYNPDIQTKVQKEIDDVLLRYDNQLCYEAITEMTLLEKSFKESMRLFPSVGVLNRECSKKYTIPGTDITIDPGTKILIPVQALQNDEMYFEEPERFDPERFAPEEVQKRHKYVYLPFGEGPRGCIGARLGYMQSLAGLAAILQRFTFEPSKSSRRKLETTPYSNVVQAVKNGIPLKIRRRAVVE